MNFFRLTLFVIVILLGFSSLTGATTPYPFVQWINIEASSEVSLFILPDGSGPALTEAQVFGGSPMDATITLQLITEYGSPIPDFPFEDIWLEAENGSQMHCLGGFCPDSPSDMNGLVTFSRSLSGGGSSEGATYVYVVGNPAYDPSDFPYYWPHPPLELRFNSADINGDGTVNLIDLTLFSSDFFGVYNYRSDFHWDGILDLNDVARLAQGLGSSCE